MLLRMVQLSGNVTFFLMTGKMSLTEALLLHYMHLEGL